jgi:hypothetical protein
MLSDGLVMVLLNDKRAGTALATKRNNYRLVLPVIRRL